VLSYKIVRSYKKELEQYFIFIF